MSKKTSSIISVLVIASILSVSVFSTSAGAITISGSTSPSSSGSSSGSSSRPSSSGSSCPGGVCTISAGSGYGGGSSSSSYSGSSSYNNTVINSGYVVINGVSNSVSNASGSTTSYGNFSCPGCPSGGTNYNTMISYPDGVITLGRFDSNGNGYGDASVVIIAGQRPSTGTTSPGGSSYTPSTPTPTPTYYETLSFVSTSTMTISGSPVIHNSTYEIDSDKEYKIDFSHNITPTGHSLNASYSQVITTIDDKPTETKTISGTSYNGTSMVNIGPGEQKKVCQTVSYSPSSIKINSSTREESVYESTTKTSTACVTLKTKNSAVDEFTPGSDVE